MKKTLLIMVMALAVLLTQCRKPEVKFPSPVAPEGTTVSMTVTAGPGSKTDITPVGGITWSMGDKLYVGYNDAYVGYLTLVSGTGTPTGTFSGNLTLPAGTTDGKKEFRFFYLGSNAPAGLTPGTSTQTTVSFATQTGLRENLGSCHIGYGTAQGTVAGSEVTGINVTLVSKVALARFSFKKGGADYTGALTLSGTNIYNSMTVGFGGSFNHGATPGNITLTGGYGERYVMLVPTGATTAQTLTFTGSAEDGTGDVPGLESNKFYGKTGPIAVTLTASAVHVTGVSLNKTSLSLAAGATETLTATVSPDNATDKSVTWSSSATGVATVNDAGLVTAVAAGTATITVTTVEGGKTAKCEVTVTAPSYLPGEFTINSGGTKVKFSKGNLQYIGSATTPYWKFAEHQWDYLGSTTDQGTEAANVDRDLFGWGCTGNRDTRDYAHTYQTNFQPYSTSKTAATSGTDAYNKNRYGYGPDYVSSPGYNLEVENKSDWGCLAIGGDPAGTWRTLTTDECKYLLDTRTTATEGLPNESSRYAKVQVNGVNGMLLFPDSFAWTSAMGTAPTATNFETATFGTGTYTAAEFAEQEKSGVVFLPAAGCRNGTTVQYVGYYGYYWSSSGRTSDTAYGINFWSFFGTPGVSAQGCPYRYAGSSVRLVRE